MSEFDKQFPRPSSPEMGIFYNTKREVWLAALKWALDNAVYIHSSEVAERIIEQEIEELENEQITGLRKTERII
jgi:hypothetical protein